VKLLRHRSRSDAEAVEELLEFPSCFPGFNVFPPFASANIFERGSVPGNFVEFLEVVKYCTENGEGALTLYFKAPP